MSTISLDTERKSNWTFYIQVRRDDYYNNLFILMTELGINRFCFLSDKKHTDNENGTVQPDKYYLQMILYCTLEETVCLS